MSFLFLCALRKARQDTVLGLKIEKERKIENEQREREAKNKERRNK